MSESSAMWAAMCCITTVCDELRRCITSEKYNIFDPDYVRTLISNMTVAEAEKTCLCGLAWVRGDGTRVAGAVACRKLNLEDHWQARVSPGALR